MNQSIHSMPNSHLDIVFINHWTTETGLRIPLLFKRIPYDMYSSLNLISLARKMHHCPCRTTKKCLFFLQILSIMWVYINLFYSSGALIWAQMQPSSSICSRDMSKTKALLAPKTPKRPPPSQPIPTDFSQDVLNKRFSGDLFLFHKGIEGQELFEKLLGMSILTCWLGQEWWHRMSSRLRS